MNNKNKRQMGELESLLIQRLGFERMVALEHSKCHGSFTDKEDRVICNGCGKPVTDVIADDLRAFAHPV